MVMQDSTPNAKQICAEASQNGEVKKLQDNQYQTFSQQAKLAQEVEENAKQALEAAEKACKLQIRCTKAIFHEELQKEPEIQRLTALINSYKGRRDDSSREEEACSQKIGRIDEEIRECKGQVAHLSQECDVLSARKAENESWLVKSVPKIQRLKGKANEANEMLVELSKRLPGIDNGRYAAQEKEKCHSLNLAAAERQLLDLSSNYSVLKTTFDRVFGSSESIAAQKEEVAAMLHDVSQERQKAQDLKDQAHKEAAQIEAGLVQESERIKTVANDLAVAKLETDRLQSDAAGKEAALNDEAKRINDANNELAAISNRKKEIKQQMAMLQQESVELDDKFTATSAAFKECSGRVEQMSRELAATKHCLGVASTAQENFQSAFDASDAAINRQKEAFERTSQVAERATQMLEYSRSVEEGLRRKLDDHSTQFLELEPKLEDLNAKLQQASENIEAATQDVEKQRRLLYEAQAAVEQAEAQRESLIQGIKSAEETERRAAADAERLQQARIAVHEENDQITKRVCGTHPKLNSLAARIKQLEEERATAQSELAAVCASITPEEFDARDALKRASAQITETWKHNPPQKLEQQLEREIESILRAEAAAAFYVRQCKVLRAAAELSQIKIAPKPHIRMDDVAKERLISQHHSANGDEEKICLDTLNLVGEMHISPVKEV